MPEGGRELDDATGDSATWLPGGRPWIPKAHFQTCWRQTNSSAPRIVMRTSRVEHAAGLAVVTCMDSRIDPLRMLGLAPGDAKIVRNAGARVTDDVLRTLVLASYLLGVNRVMVVPHTDCRMTVDAEDDVHRAVAATGGPDTRSLSFLTTQGRSGVPGTRRPTDSLISST